MVVSGCSVLQEDKIDYKSAQRGSTLDVPPDLTQLSRENRYNVPGAAVSASSFEAARPAAATVGTATSKIGDVRIERAGNQRWLVVDRPANQLWGPVRDFWQENGFLLELDQETLGIMETDWAENRAKIPQDFIRSALGKIFDSLYSTGERDKFRTRLERLPDGSTEIWISHRGAEEVLAGAQKETTIWTVRPNDPGLEAQFLGRLVAQLTGVKETKPAETMVANAPVAPQQATLVGNAVELNEGFDRAWRRVGLALDRVGFTVEDRDRVQGVYFVRYVDPDAASKDGFFKKLFTFGSDDKAKEAQRYRVIVKAEQGASTSQVSVQTNDGKSETGETGAKILKLLTDELK